MAIEENEVIAVQVSRTPTPHVTGQRPEDIASLPPGRIVELSRAQIAALRPAQVEALSDEQMRALLPTHIATLSPEQVRALRPPRLRALSKEQLRALTEGQVAALDRAQIGTAVYPRAHDLDDDQRGWLHKRMSYLAICTLTASTAPRPHAFSLWSAEADATDVSDYVSWPSLVDRRFTARHLPPWDRESVERHLPRDDAYLSSEEHGKVTALFKRGRKGFKGSRSSLLFPVFAQWFTDSFLRTDTADRRRNTSNHEIDMCQLYGLEESTARTLRTLDGSGMLKHEIVAGEMYPPRLFDDRGDVKTEFRELPHVKDGSCRTMLNRFPDRFERQKSYFATGLGRGNSTFGYAALNTLFLREHNRLCRGLAAEHPSWDDERLFQTARMIVTVLEIKIVVEEYINHIYAPPDDPARPRVFRLDPDFAENESWYRSNRIAIEFDLLYRWHALIPDRVHVDGTLYEPREFLTNNAPLVHHGLDTVLLQLSAQPAGALALFNTPEFLLAAEYQAIKMGRDFRLQPYNAYRERFGLEPIESHAALSADGSVTSVLKTLYPDVDRLELLIGLYAEDPKGDELFGELMTAMVAYDAFTQALTNPLLSRNVYGADTLTRHGMETIAATASLDDVWKRNRGPAAEGSLTMDHARSTSARRGRRA